MEKQTQRRDTRTQGLGRREEVRCVERVTGELAFPCVR